ncbi:minor tail protein [Gordonia phage Bosnia]|uniref:Minor tail protein n=1 Tax=Gordonia phage Bosnia TaxID=2776839 RepID=A0A7L8ZD80_9CAUD|nr:minor tail protein [Gordonia phage Bosnia]QOI66849.1 minor tail protein [Gordonia phage Bosnia]
MTAPGYARPNTSGPGDFDYLDLGRRNNPRIDWRPIGRYEEVGVNWTWGLEPGKFAFELHPNHPLNDEIAQADIDKHIYHFRAGLRGMPFTGRVMQRKQIGTAGREKFLYTGVCNKIWLQRSYAWVNNLFPPEIQISLTGKQAIVVGPPDPTFKWYIGTAMTRLNKPVYCALPIRWPSAWTQADMKDFNSLESVLDMMFNATEEIVGLMARFTQHDELFKQTAERLEMGVSLDLWDNIPTSPTGGPAPQVFRTDSLAALQSIIDHTSDHFLDFSQLLKPINNGLFALHPDRACYVFNTHEKRDRREVQFRTDSEGQIANFELTVNAPDATRAIVGGKSPSMVNDLIEIGANLAIAAIIGVIATIPGLAGVGGLAVTVGDLFDDIFFAYQVFVDHDLEDQLGDDDALPEVFADNTAAWSIDSYAVGKTTLHEHAGNKQLEITGRSGRSDGLGISFGADDGTARRYRHGDIVTFWDRGNTVEKYVSGVAVTSKPGERMREALTVGNDKRAKGPWTRLITGVQGAGQWSRGAANST